MFINLELVLVLVVVLIDSEMNVAYSLSQAIYKHTTRFRAGCRSLLKPRPTSTKTRNTGILGGKQSRTYMSNTIISSESDPHSNSQAVNLNDLENTIRVAGEEIQLMKKNPAFDKDASDFKKKINGYLALKDQYLKLKGIPYDSGVKGKESNKQKSPKVTDSANATPPHAKSMNAAITAVAEPESLVITNRTTDYSQW
jgi:hypothetical protein